MKTWKKLEARAAEKLHVFDPTATRNPLSGRMSKHDTSADILTSLPWYVECKGRTSFSHHTLFFNDVAKPAKEEGKIPFLVTHEKNKKDDLLVTLKLDDLIKLLTDGV